MKPSQNKQSDQEEVNLLRNLCALCERCGEKTIYTFRWKTAWWICLFLAMTDVSGLANSTSIPLSKLVEATGSVECVRHPSNQWKAAKAGVLLYHNDRVRTGKKSRAAIQLSDKSVIRLNQLTTIQIKAPSPSNTKRIFEIKGGSLYFFNREKPADIEFRTPLSSGSIRGTEFVIDVDELSGESNLTMLDGEVLLKGPQNEVTLRSGEKANITLGKAIVKSKAIETLNIIQWTLYYPSILDPSELELTDQEQTLLAPSLEAYARGNYLQAMENLPHVPLTQSPTALIYAAGMWLNVGQAQTCLNLMQNIPEAHPLNTALQELIAAVKFQELTPLPTPQSSSHWLARSYYLQSRSDLTGAQKAASEAVRLSPSFGQARTRLAELEFARGHHRRALNHLELAQNQCPSDPRVAVLQGFVLLDQNKISAALAEFEQATELDAAMSEGWLGQGLCYLLKSDTDKGQQLLQIAAALEPNRSLLRSYLGKAFAENNDKDSANKDFKRAKALDPNDPTPWLYSALFLQQQNRLNEAIKALETSRDLNDNQSLFRSKLRLDQDRATRTANLAALYEETGLNEIAERDAARSVAIDYGNFSTHHYLASSIGNKSTPYSIEQRFETTRESERLMSNLLAPIGGENLSRQLSAQERLRYYSIKPLRSTAFTEYRSNGDWTYGGALFGAFPEAQFSYALDVWKHDWSGWRPNSDLENAGMSLQLKHQLTDQDGLYIQISQQDFESGDLARYYQETNAKQNYRYSEKSAPDLITGLHHQWSPQHKTLLLASRFDHDIQVTDTDPNVLFVRRSATGMISGIETPPLFDLEYESQYELYSLELQHIWQTEHQALIAGTRYQNGQIQTLAQLNRQLTGPVTRQSLSPDMNRFDTYAYYQWQVIDTLKLITGLTYEHLQYPVNTDFLPISNSEDTKGLVSPKLGLLYQPQKDTHIRAMYSRSLGGLFFDNSVRLQPTQLAGYSQAYRSIIPESVVGQIAGTRFDILGIGLDHRWKSGTYFGISTDWMRSKSQREIGALTHSGVLPIPDTPTALQENLRFEEVSLSVNIQQLIGNYFVIGGRSRNARAQLNTAFPGVPDTVNGISQLNRSQHGWLHQIGLFTTMNLPSGIYAKWESNWFHQSNKGYTPARPGDSFFQHNFFLGYHFPRRTAELKLGVLNMSDESFQLNPLNFQSWLPQERTFTFQFSWRY